jgi:hypothetical protein
MPDRPRVTLHQQTGSTYRHIFAHIKTDDRLLVESNDGGSAPGAFMGASSYDYWVQVPAAHKDGLLLALIAEKYSGRERAVEEFRDWCQEHSLQHQFVTWPSFDGD